MNTSGWAVGCVRVVSLLVVIASAVGCSSTSLVSSWVSPDRSPVARVYVAGLSSFPGLRRVYEDAACNALSLRHVSSMPSYSNHPESDVAPTGELLMWAQTSQADALVTTEIARVVQQVDTYPARPMYGPWAGRFPMMAGPGYWGPQNTYSHDIAFAETNVYRVRDGFLMASFMTRTDTSDYSARQVREIAKVVVNQMAADGLLVGAKVVD